MIPTLELALDKIIESGWRVPCVIAGHMHDRLLGRVGIKRSRFVRRGPTLFVNPAVVPRIRQLDGATVSHYLRLVWRAGTLERCEEIWVDAEGCVRAVDEPRIKGD